MKQDIWIFGYGSLVWQPGFKAQEQQIARMDGYARSFCMWSIHHRGSPQRKGLVLALNKQKGAYCDGVAFRVCGENAKEVLTYLRGRELISSAYLEVQENVLLRDGKVVRAYTYVIDPMHEQYTGALTLDKQVEIIAHAHGGRGPNSEYLYMVTHHLCELGIEDKTLNDLSQRVREVLKTQ